MSYLKYRYSIIQKGREKKNPLTISIRNYCYYWFSNDAFPYLFVQISWSSTKVRTKYALLCSVHSDCTLRGEGGYALYRGQLYRGTQTDQHCFHILHARFSVEYIYSWLNMYNRGSIIFCTLPSLFLSLVDLIYTLLAIFFSVIFWHISAASFSSLFSSSLYLNASIPQTLSPAASFPSQIGPCSPP